MALTLDAFPASGRAPASRSLFQTLLPSARRLLAESQLAAATLEQAGWRPTDFRDLQRFLRDEDPALAEFLAYLLRANLREGLYADLILERLCYFEDWHYPAQVVPSASRTDDQAMGAL